MREFGHTGVIRGADGDVMRIYCETVARYEKTSRLLDQSGPLVRGARSGELVKNPLHQVVRDNATLVRSLAGELGLTPADGDPRLVRHVGNMALKTDRLGPRPVTEHRGSPRSIDLGTCAVGAYDRATFTPPSRRRRFARTTRRKVSPSWVAEGDGC